MVQAFLIKYAEIGIKGKNRYVFEDALVRRVKERLERCEAILSWKKSREGSM